MAFSFLFGLIFVVLAVASACMAYHGNKQKKSGMRTMGVIFFAVFLICFILVPFSFHQIDTGEIAVVKYMGEAKEVKTAGVHFDLWVTNTYNVYDAKVQNVDIVTSAYSSDAQTMDIQMTIQYQVIGDKVLDIAKQYGSLEILQNRIQSVVLERTKATLSEYKAMDIIANRTSMSPIVEDTIRNAIGESYYVNVVAVVLTNIDFSQAFETAVEEKMIAEQNKLKADYENETKVAMAQAEADAKLIEAEAQAKANELLEQSITDRILQKEYLDKWDGKLPSVMGSGDLSMILPNAFAPEMN